jgi:hypothetical protein
MGDNSHTQDEDYGLQRDILRFRTSLLPEEDIANLSPEALAELEDDPYADLDEDLSLKELSRTSKGDRSPIRRAAPPSQQTSASGPSPHTFARLIHRASAGHPHLLKNRKHLINDLGKQAGLLWDCSLNGPRTARPKLRVQRRAQRGNVRRIPDYMT